MRVPTLVAGPFVRQGCVISEPLEHVSIISTLTKRYELEPLNERVAATRDLSVCIDPQFLRAPRPPVRLPPVPIVDAAWKRRSPSGAHSEIRHALRTGAIPRHLDRTKDSVAIAERVLSWGERLGAVRRIR